MGVEKYFLVVFTLFVVFFVLLTLHFSRQKNPRFRFLRKSKEEKLKEIKRENEKRLEVADGWIGDRKKREAAAALAKTRESAAAAEDDEGRWVYASSSSRPPPSSRLDVIVISTPRRGDFRSLTQSVTRLATLAERQNAFATRVIICDVSTAHKPEKEGEASEVGASTAEDYEKREEEAKSDIDDDKEAASHPEANSLSRWFALIKPTPTGASGATKLNIFEKEKRDYVFCLNATSYPYSSSTTRTTIRSAIDDRDGGKDDDDEGPQPSGDFVLLLEDDAYPEDDLFHVLDDVVHRRWRRVDEFRSALFFKLYHPERLMGYFNPEPTRILEWILVSALTATVLKAALSYASASRWVATAVAATTTSSVVIGALTSGKMFFGRKRLDSACSSFRRTVCRLFFSSSNVSPSSTTTSTSTPSSSSSSRSKRLPTYLVQWTLCFVFALVALASLVDRNSTVLQLRRFSPFLYGVVPAPNCCTVAILFPRRQIADVVSQMSAAECRAKYAKDAVLDEIKWRHESGAYSVEPNLFKHIGFYSTLRKSPTVNPFQMR